METLDFIICSHFDIYISPLCVTKVRELYVVSGFVVSPPENEKKGHRPVLVEFKSRTTKNMVMKSMSKLKSAEAKYKQLSIIHDMTQKERV